MADRSAPPSPPSREEDRLSFSVQSFFVDDAGCLSSVTLPWHVDLAGGAQGEDACLRLLVAVAKAHRLFPAPDPVPAAAAAEGAAPPLLPPAAILPPASSATSKAAGRQSKAAASDPPRSAEEMWELEVQASTASRVVASFLVPPEALALRDVGDSDPPAPDPSDPSTPRPMPASPTRQPLPGSIPPPSVCGEWRPLATHADYLVAMVCGAASLSRLLTLQCYLKEAPVVRGTESRRGSLKGATGAGGKQEAKAPPSGARSRAGSVAEADPHRPPPCDPSLERASGIQCTPVKGSVGNKKGGGGSGSAPAEVGRASVAVTRAPTPLLAQGGPDVGPPMLDWRDALLADAPSGDSGATGFPGVTSASGTTALEMLSAAAPLTTPDTFVADVWRAVKARELRMLVGPASPAPPSPTPPPAAPPEAATVMQPCQWGALGCTGAGDTARLWWCDSVRGTVGWADPVTQHSTVIAGGLSIPVGIGCLWRGGNGRGGGAAGPSRSAPVPPACWDVVVLEQGGVWALDGALRCVVGATGQLVTLADELQNPRCLVLVPGSLAHDVGIGGTQSDGATCSDTYLFWLEGPDKSDRGADARDRGSEAWEGHSGGTSVHCMRVGVVEDGAFSQRCVLSRPAHRGGRVTALAVLPGLELVLAVQQDLDSVVGEGSFERYRCKHEPMEGPEPTFDSIPFSYSPSDVRVERCQPVVTSMHYDTAHNNLWCCSQTTSPESPGGLYCCRLPAPERLALRRRNPSDTLSVACDATGNALFTRPAPEHGRHCVVVVRIPAAAPPSVSALASGISCVEVSGARMLRGTSSPGKREAGLSSPGLKQASVDSMDSPIRDMGFGSLAGTAAGGTDEHRRVNVQVILRSRPLLQKEIDEDAESILTCRRNEVEVAKYAAYVQRKVYLFHRVFSESTQQRQLYRQAVRPLILKALEGYNFTCFAYGQTGTGKTFTLTGDLSSSTGSADMGSAPIHELASRAGIIPRCIHTIFDELRETAESYTVTVSHLEIYNEELADLLEKEQIIMEDRLSTSGRAATTSRSQWLAAKKRGLPMVLISRSLLRQVLQEGSGGTGLSTPRDSSDGPEGVPPGTTAPADGADTPSATASGGAGGTGMGAEGQDSSPRAPLTSRAPNPLLRSKSATSAMRTPMASSAHAQSSPFFPPTPTAGVASSPLSSPMATARRKVLKIVKDDTGAVVVTNLTAIPVKSPEEIFDILGRSFRRRATSETLMNQFSSRSHSIFTVNVSATVVNPAGSRVTKTSRLNFVDLSGSENMKRSGSEGARQTEASSINRGLLALGRVIKAIVDKRSHVPFRDSKLTRLLEESLGGNALTLMILTVSPCHIDADETVSTLNYANMAKMIINEPQQNSKTEALGGTLERTETSAATAQSRGGDEGDYVRPWQKRVPIIIRSASSREDLDGLRGAGTGVGLGASLGTDPGPPPKRLHAECQDWVARNVLTPGGALRPAAAACLALVYHGAAGGPADHAPGVGAPDGALARPTVLKGPAIRALAGRMRRVVLELAVQQVLAEGTEDAVKLEPGGAAQRRPSTLTGSRPGSAVSRAPTSRPQSAMSRAPPVGSAAPPSAAVPKPGRPGLQPSHVAIASDAAAALARVVVPGSGQPAPKAPPGLSPASADPVAVFERKHRMKLSVVLAAASAVDVDVRVDPASVRLPADASLSLHRFLQYMAHKAVSQPQLLVLLLGKHGFDASEDRGARPGTPAWMGDASSGQLPPPLARDSLFNWVQDSHPAIPAHLSATATALTDDGRRGLATGHNVASAPSLGRTPSRGSVREGGSSLNTARLGTARTDGAPRGSTASLLLASGRGAQGVHSAPMPTGPTNAQLEAEAVLVSLPLPLQRDLRAIPSLAELLRP